MFVFFCEVLFKLLCSFSFVKFSCYLPWFRVSFRLRGREKSHVMEDEGGEKMASLFEDKIKGREKQLKKRKKRLDGLK
jgi:hypothetical protein